MHKSFQFKHTPQLMMRSKYWSLSCDETIGGVVVHYELRVSVFWDGQNWYRYSFFRCDESLGEPLQLITREDWHKRLNVVRDNEGDIAYADAAAIYYDKFDIIQGIEVTLQDALIRRWEAMAELISPSNT